MADFGYNRIRAVGLALLEASGMHMHVSNDRAVGLTTMSPEVAQTTAIDFDDTTSQRVRIYVVVVDELLDPSCGAPRTQEEGTAFVSATCTLPELRDAVAPHS